MSSKCYEVTMVLVFETKNVFLSSHFYYFYLFSFVIRSERPVPRASVIRSVEFSERRKIVLRPVGFFSFPESWGQYYRY